MQNATGVGATLALRVIALKQSKEIRNVEWRAGPQNDSGYHAQESESNRVDSEEYNILEAVPPVVLDKET